ncbi:MAG: hypothetical protein JOZ69_16420, partial [Myxococcales bacterium]|nr:hypothetical protein [Myxococcales bacterium]
AIESYSEIVRYLGDKDPTSRRLIEELLAKEEEHANDLSDLLARLDSSSSRDDAGKKSAAAAP